MSHLAPLIARRSRAYITDARSFNWIFLRLFMYVLAAAATVDVLQSFAVVYL